MFYSNKRGVSPIIGAILLVALTLALVSIATFIFFEFTEDVGNIQDSSVEITEDKEVYVTDMGNAEEIIVQYNDGDQSELSFGEIYVPKDTEYSVIAIKGSSDLLLNSVQTNTVGSGTCNPDNQEKIFEDMSGDGTENNPYQITNECELQSMNEDLTAYYELVNNINADETENWNSQSGFEPIGNEENNEFEGNFDGNNYEISDLYIDRNIESNGQYVGLFGLTTNSDIHNLYLSNVNVRGMNTTGGLIGHNDNTTIKNITIDGDIESTSGQYTGGLIGKNSDINSTIDNIDINANVYGVNSTGGIVGETKSNITNSIISGTVNGTTDVGGVVGNTVQIENENIDREINNITSSTDVYGSDRVGGILGYADSDENFSIINTNSVGDITGEKEHIAGIVGFVSNNETINNATYSGDIITTSNKVGGIAGYIEGEIIDSSNNGEIIVENSNDSDTVYVGGVVGILKSDSKVINSSSSGYVEGNNKNVGGLVGLMESDTTIIESYSTSDVRNNDGTIGGLVGNALYNSEINNSYSVGDINTGSDNVGGIAGKTNSDIKINNVYSNTNISTNGNKTGGLIGYAEGFVEINNTNSTGNISGNYKTGGLIGHLEYGELRNSYSKNNISGDERVGGLIGHFRAGDIENSNSTSNITNADIEVGGLVGYMKSDAIANITQSYAHVDIKSDNYVGGLVGYQDEDNKINESYSTGFINASDDEVGGFIGKSNDTVINSYWDTESSNQSDGIGDGSGDVEGLDTDEMQGSNAENNMDSFDFTDTWVIVENPDDYPILQD